MLLQLTDLKKRIEYSLCQHFATTEDVKTFCERAKVAEVGVACLNPVHVALAAELLAGTKIELSGNVGFPFGSHPTMAKVVETEHVVRDGATQIDMVINVGALKSRQDSMVMDDIKAVVDAAEGRPVKTIIETWVLSREEKTRACRLAEEAGAYMIKTSTGVRTQYLDLVNQQPRGALPEDIVLIRQTLKKATKIKASGGIYTLEDVIALLKAGADQLGVSKGEELIRKFAVEYPHGLEI
ncbi:MAG: deoxyribose-phosphate aldolase [Anaerolineales bacterium]|nr:deoxyribose-phosphate aldolase [Anaerolineales bacterium]